MTTFLIGLGLFTAFAVLFAAGQALGRPPLRRGCTAPVPGLGPDCACDRPCPRRGAEGGAS